MSDDGLRFQRTEPPPPPPPRRDLRRPVLIGVGVAIVLGLALGFWVRPNLDSGKAAANTATVTNSAVPIEVAPGATNATMATVEKPGGKLEVLPPDMAAAANARAPVAPVLPAPDATASGAPAATVAPLPAPQPAPQVASPPPQAYASAAPRMRMTSGCDGLPSLADQMVCQDPRLAAADREMMRAYRRAMSAGAPPGQLRSEQRDFAMIREDAARRSPRALASAYAQRIEELNAMAEDSDRDEGPGY